MAPLRVVPLWWLVERTGFNRRTIQRLRNRQAEPRPRTEDVLTRAAGNWARRELQERGLSTSRSDPLACQAWLEAVGK